MRRLAWTDLIFASLHFWLGFSVGLLTFSSTWITYRHFSPAGPGAIAAFCIVALSFSASVASHVLEDYCFSCF
jgi:hypothetical protein